MKNTPVTPIPFLLFIALLITTISSAQTKSEQQSVYLLSNLETLDAEALELDAIEAILKKETADYTLIVTGDFVDKNGLGEKPSKTDLAKIDRLTDLVNSKGQLLFIPGDKEWDNGGDKGLKKVKAIQDYLEKKLDSNDIFLPRNGCMGPTKIDIGKHLRIVAVNSQWFNHHHKRPEEEDTDCKIFNEHEFWDELDDELADGDNRNIILTVHHPPISYGQYAGYKLTGKHLLPPVVGSFIASYHQNIGGPKDLANKELTHFSEELLKKTKKHPGLLIVSGHEYDLQLLKKDGNYFINSGAFAKSKQVARGKETLYRSGKNSFTKLIFHKNGKVDMQVYSIDKSKQIELAHEHPLFASPCEKLNDNVPANILYNPCDDLGEQAKSNSTQVSKATAVAGSKYDIGWLFKTILGKNYRKTWAAPIQDVPYLDVENSFGGLRPYAKGGSAQTTSLKFKSEDGQRFAFRSVDKNPTRRMDQGLARGVYGKVSKDRTSHQHPYASLVTASMMDILDLPHSEPKLHLMPDHPILGPFRAEFADTYGFLELKPKGKKKTDNAYKGADKVVSSFQMFRKLLDDNDNKLDVDVYIKARLFDMLVADWDRHENNWKWLAYKGKKGYNYTPFPKDRDKAFSLLDGIYGIRLLKTLYINKSDFTNKYSNLKYLNYKSRNMDRWLANSYTYEDWMAAAKNVKEKLTDEVIDQAVSQLPPEAQKTSGDKLKRILKVRRNGLVEVTARYYKMLARYIDLVGSNSREYFELTRKENGNVVASIYKLKKSGEVGSKIYEREFKKSETREIRLYGLGKKDRFKISGESDKSILIRIIGGDGKDEIEDVSKVKGWKKHTRIYDKHDKDELNLSQESKVVNIPEKIAFKTESLFQYNDATFLPFTSYNNDDGLTLGLTGKIIRHGFNKPNFSKKINVQGAVTTNQNYNFSIDAQFRHVIKKWDLVFGVSQASRDKSMVRFYGFGNDVVINDSLRRLDYYTNFTGSTEAYLGLTRQFWKKSSFTASIKLDRKDVKPDPDNNADASIYNSLPPNNGLGETTALGPEVSFNLDFRDNGAFPTRGMQLIVHNYTFYNSDLDWELGGRVNTELSGFITKGIKVPITLALKGQLTNSYGDTPFYYKSFLGQQGNHRGFLRNRFGGDAALSLNTDLRFHFGKVITPLVPVKYGIFGLYDVGRVWLDGEDSDAFHHAYGGGIYLVPYADNLNLTLTYAKSDEGDKLFSFRVGFFVR